MKTAQRRRNQKAMKIKKHHYEKIIMLKIKKDKTRQMRK